MRRLAAVCALAVMVGACLPDFEHPLPAAKNLRVDKALLGTWYFKSENELQSYIVKPEKDGRMAITICKHDPNRPEEPNCAPFGTMYASVIGKDKFANIKSADPNAKTYLIMKYEVMDSNLVLTMFGTRKIQAMVEKGILKGKIKGDDVTVSSSGEEMESAIKQYGAEVFMDPNAKIVLSRKRPF
jgi:hypothetical protein